jgi:hypothetical protein
MRNFLTWEWCRVYLATGLVMLYLMRTVAIWLDRTRTGKPWWEELRSTFIPENGINWKDALITLLGFSLLSVVWPVLVLWMLINTFSGQASWRSKLPEAAFTCKPPHLRKTITQVDAEKLGAIIDPLGRAPALPFGHLNAGWLAFLGKKAEGFALWYFEVPCNPISTGESTQPVFSSHRGLAWVKSRKVKAEFIFEGN